MTPVQSLQMLLKVNKPVAIFILSGLGLLAASGIAISWVGDQRQALFVAAWILGLAFVVTIITFIVTNERMKFVLGWVFTTIFVLFLVGLIESALGFTGRLPVPACYLRMFWEHPKACEQRLFPVEEVKIAPPAPFRLAQVGPARLWAAQVDARALEDAPRREPPYDSALLYIHVGPAIPEADYGGIVDTLAALGWPGNGGVEGVQMIKRVPDQNQVRYFDPGTREDAFGLARALKRARPGPPVYVRDFSRSGLVARDGLLEVWISN